MTSCSFRAERRQLRHRLADLPHRPERAREAVFIQSTPDGDVDVVYWEADDVEAALTGMAVSDDPFDRWFRDLVRDVHGINVEDGFPPPEQIMDYRA